jgi:ABC-2 type transport system permease protein
MATVVPGRGPGSQSLRREAPFLLAWSAALLVLAMACLLLYRPYVQTAALVGFIGRIPNPIREVFDLGGLTTARGFVEATLYGLVMPIAYLSVAIGVGSRAFAHADVAGNAPVPARRTLLLVGSGVLILTVVLAAALEIAPVAGGVDVVGLQALTATAALALLGLDLGFLTLLVGRITGRVGIAAAVATAAALAADAVNGAASFLPGLSAVRYLSPVYYAEAGHPLAHGVSAVHLVVLTVVAAVLATAVVFGHRLRPTNASA